MINDTNNKDYFHDQVIIEMNLLKYANMYSLGIN